MIVEIAALCDAATDQAGKLNLLGTFDRLHASLPLVLPQCAAAFRIRYSRSEGGEHLLTLHLEDLSGVALIPPLDSRVIFPAVQNPYDSQAVNLVLNIQRLRLEKAGKYVLRLRIDQIEAVSLPIWMEDSTPMEPNPLA